MASARTWIMAAVLLAVAIALPFVVPTYYVQFASKVLIMGILAMALNLVVGFGGLVSMCHAAFFGLGGYALALATPKYDPASFFVSFPFAVGVAALAALVIGALALRTRGVYFIMVTLAFGEMLFFLFHDTQIAGGSDGAFINYKPEIAIAGQTLLNLDKPLVFYFLVLAFLVATIAFLAMLVRSPFGHALAAARDNERRARSLGFAIFRLRLTAFVISGAIAGVAGYLAAAQYGYVAPQMLGFAIFRLRLTAFVISGAIAGVAGYLAAAQYGYVAPQMLGWHVSATILVMVLIGGLRSVAGPLLGALVLLGLEEVLKSATEYWKLIEGLVIIAIVLALPDGMRHLLTAAFGTTEEPDETPVAGAKHV